MKKCTNVISLIIICIMILFNEKNVLAKEIPTIKVLKATNDIQNGLPIYEVGGDGKTFEKIYDNSFIKKSIELYGEAQKYAQIKSDEIYLIFKENSGCYGRIGFYLKENGQIKDKTKSPYIELSTSMLKGPYDRVSSITQILPHEMGHILYEITTDKRKESDIGSVDMHYSNIITEYNTAFNEGFAEHFEVISEMYEENEGIKKGIINDIERSKNKINPILQSAKKDFRFPLRLDYYRVIAPFWLQSKENIKRHELGVNGDGKYKNLNYSFSNSEESILYRNMGMNQDKAKLRNIQQSISTEIVISNFFVKLINSDNVQLNERYNKVFNIFNKYVNKDERPQIIQFVKGYIREYPKDKDRILNIFKESTGYEYIEEYAPEIWITCESGHINMIMDQFGGMKIPYYIFNINTCEKEDLLKLKDINVKDAEKIIEYRDKNKWFNSRDEFEKVKGISTKSVEILKNNSDRDKIKALNIIDENKFKFSNLFIANIEHLIVRSLIWFIIFMLVYYIIIRYALKISINNLRFKIIVVKFFKFILYIFLGLISLIVGSTVIIHNRSLNVLIVILILILIIQSITILFIRKNKVKVRESLISSLIILVIVMYSLV